MSENAASLKTGKKLIGKRNGRENEVDRGKRLGRIGNARGPRGDRKGKEVGKRKGRGEGKIVGKDTGEERKDPDHGNGTTETETTDSTGKGRDKYFPIIFFLF